MKELEKEFRDIVEAHKDEINAKVKEASKALTEAETLSQKYGIPFRSSVSRIRQVYTPASFGRFNQLDDELIYELIETCGGDYPGWQHSAVC